MWLEAPPPVYRLNATAVYDRNQHRMILFGGVNSVGERNDVWVLDLAAPNRWQRLQPNGTPPSVRRSHTAVYDPIGDRMLVFGGGIIADHTWVLNNEVWALELGGTPHWTLLAPTGTPPSARFAAVAVFDVARNRMLLHGGALPNGSTIGDLWRLELSGTPAWVKVSNSTAMGARAFATAEIDSVRDRMLVMGGIVTFTSLADTWQGPLGGGSWSQVTTTGSGPTTLGHAAVFDPLHDQMVVYGGSNIATQTFLRGAWRLQFGTTPATWSRAPLAGAVPPATEGASAIYDPVASALRIFGGWSGPSALDSLNQNVWTLSLHPTPEWGAPLPAHAPPAAGRKGASVAYDSQNRRMFMIGGWRGDLGGFGTAVDVWKLDLTAVTPSWTPMAPVGTPPAGRGYASLVYDSSDDRLVLYGGEDSLSRHADVWTLTLTGTPTWTQLAPTGTTPAGRSRHGAIYDPARDRMVIFGGSSLVFPYFGNDVWELSLSGAPAWSPLAPAGAPPAGRRETAVVLDAERDRMIVFGGISDTTCTNDVWALGLAGGTAWDSVEVAAGPAPRRAHTAVVDPGRDRLLVFGGYAGAGSGTLVSNDLWSLSLSGSPEWSQLQPAGSTPEPDAEHSAIYDAVFDRMIQCGGVRGLNGTWIYWSGAALAVPSHATPVTGKEIRATPNPSRAGFDLSFVLPSAGRAQLGIFDLTGRRVSQIVDASLPAGRHAARWSGLVGGKPAAAGVYFARFEHAGGVAATRLLRIR